MYSTGIKTANTTPILNAELPRISRRIGISWWISRIQPIQLHTLDPFRPPYILPHLTSPTITFIAARHLHQLIISLPYIYLHQLPNNRHPALIFPSEKRAQDHQSNDNSYPKDFNRIHHNISTSDLSSRWIGAVPVEEFAGNGAVCWGCGHGCDFCNGCLLRSGRIR